MKMDASKTPMNTVSRRTRSRWDIFYRNLYNELKAQESSGTSVEKQDSWMNGGNTSGVEITEQDDEGSGTRDVKRIRKKVSKISGSGKTGETVKKMIPEDAKNDNLAGVRMRLRSMKKFDLRAKKDDDDAEKGDDEVIYLGEEVVSNGLSSKVGSESRSGSHSKPSSVDEIVSRSSKQVKKTNLIADQVKNGVVHGRGRPGIKQLNERRPDDASINLENAVDSEDSADSWLYGSDFSNKDDASDEDYKEIKPSGSYGSHVSHCNNDAERTVYDECEVDDDDSSIKIDADPGEENSSHMQSHTISMPPKKIHEQGKLNCPVIVIKSDESASSSDEESESLIKEGGFQNKHTPKRSQATNEGVKLTKKKIRLRRNLDIIRMLEDSIDALGESASPSEGSAWTQINLPLKFRFEDEVQPLPEKTEWEKEIDSLFGDLEMGLRECEIGCPNSSEYTPPLGRRDRKEFAGSRSFISDQIHLQYPACGIPDHAVRTKGTIWELMAGIENELYPHQREGLEFIWKNVAGDIQLEKLKCPLSDGGRGCIISHAPGTGKTRLTIAFLLTFMKLYPNCRPVVIAPRGMLFTWEDELSKWLVDVPFHNMNKEELSDDENNIASIFLRQVGGGGIGLEHVRLAKLLSWMKRKSILGISYRLFEQLAGDNERGRQNEQIRKQLLESPGVLVLDEGHTARNSKSLMWKALTKVATQRRIMLTGTPFQNNFTELYNTLCLVNPKFANHFKSDETRQTSTKKRGRNSDAARSKFMDFASSICKNTDEELKKLRGMLDPFVHLHKGSILQDSLPGLRNTLVFLYPTELQNTLLEIATRERNIFHRIQLVSLISVHPSLVSEWKRFSDYKKELEEIELTFDAGVKTKFIMNLISLADALGERVLIFSQFLDPLVCIKKQLESQFSWYEGKQVLYMDGKSDAKNRQEKISSFNDHSSKAKVLLASQRACSEGISLVGASRVVLIDTVWNPSVERQAVSRAFRLGQKKVVFVYRLMTSGSEFMQFAQQAEKDRMSQLIFSPVDEDTYSSERSRCVSDDKVLDALVNLENFRHSFAKIIHQPKESDLIEIFKSVDLR
ncbi:SNF2 domain-containing protein CLASSY 3-like isoform X2 [Henckelia pumila]|uniref:SNF2 domain-containing protein CLASSY 3-like isoform X2 n=1 Tax=Henckelia pumila TaxID=405737 RepID=UPI003C6E39F2